LENLWNTDRLNNNHRINRSVEPTNSNDNYISNDISNNININKRKERRWSLDKTNNNLY